MSGAITATVGASIVGGIIASDASKSAAQTQAGAATQASNNSLAATQQSLAMQQGMFNQNQANQQPYMQAGNTALAALMGGMGLGNPYASQIPQAQNNPNNPTMTPGGVNLSQPVPGSQMQGNLVPGPNGGMIQGGMVVGNTPAAGTGSATGNLSALTPTTAGGVQNYGANAQQMSDAANSQITNGVGNFTKTFSPSDMQTDPSYQFRLQQGLQSLNASGAATGMAGSGQNLKDITNYGQGAASQEYQNQFNRFMTQQNNQVSRLQSMAGLGQNSAAGVGNNGVTTGGNMANTTMQGAAASNQYLTGAAQANASGQVGTANAIGGAISSGANSWANLQMANNFNNNAGIVPGVTPANAGNAVNMAGFQTPVAPIAY